ncbi:MAG: hypothetical protein RQ760_16465 [Sedimentisphaerales bacterium]|nr:hypothetical protein [Sedimentisphaerales bacterium]
MAAKNTAQRLRNRHGDMKIITRQQFGGALLEPCPDLVTMTGRAVSVAAGMIDVNLFTALVTLVKMEEEPQCKTDHLERAFGRILAVTLEEIVTDLRFGQFGRRAPGVLDELLNGIQIGSPGCRGQTGQFHIREKLSFQMIGI